MHEHEYRRGVKKNVNSLNWNWIRDYCGRKRAFCQNDLYAARITYALRFHQRTSENQNHLSIGSLSFRTVNVCSWLDSKLNFKSYSDAAHTHTHTCRQHTDAAQFVRRARNEFHVFPFSFGYSTSEILCAIEIAFLPIFAFRFRCSDESTPWTRRQISAFKTKRNYKCLSQRWTWTKTSTPPTA